VPGRYQGLARHSASVPEAEAWQVARLLKEQPLQPGLSMPLDAKRILRYAGLGGSRNVIDRPDSCCSEQRCEWCTDHFRTFMGCWELAWPFPCRQLCVSRGSQGVDEYSKSGSTKQIVLVSWPSPPTREWTH